jgi:hypothetical protein
MAVTATPVRLAPVRAIRPAAARERMGHTRVTPISVTRSCDVSIPRPHKGTAAKMGGDEGAHRDRCRAGGAQAEAMEEEPDHEGGTARNAHDQPERDGNDLELGEVGESVPDPGARTETGPAAANSADHAAEHRGGVASEIHSSRALPGSVCPRNHL